MADDDLARMRRAYAGRGLDRDDLAPHPLEQFRAWLDDAVDAGLPEPNAMVLATVGADGSPSARTVLLKGLDHGFVCYTNLDSRKSRELSRRPRAALVFSWIPLERQVRVVGAAERVSDAAADAYFATRPRASQLGAWASPQSTVIPDRGVLERAWDAADAAHPGAVPRPPRWGGWRVVPDEVEFWQGGADRLHDRLRYRAGGDGWTRERLAP